MGGVRSLAIVVALLGGVGLLAAGPALAKPPTEVGRAVRMDVSRPLRSIPPAKPVAGRAWPVKSREGESPASGAPGSVWPDAVTPDPLRQALTGPALAAPSMLTSWDGVSNSDNPFPGGVPPDPEGDVGVNDYVQWVNLEFEIWSKSGSVLYGPAAGSTLWSGFGGACESYNLGDPQVVFDRIADRWVFMQFAGAGPYYLCFAVSRTSDPTGSYDRYAFDVNTSTGYFPDYPKLGVWPDGYYVSANNLNGKTPVGAAVFAFDRSKMLDGDPSASFIEYQQPFQYQYLLPASFTGSTLPPDGEPEYFGAIDTVCRGIICNTTDSTLQLWRFHADFATPSNSSFSGPTDLSVASYNYGLCENSGCIPQPGTSETLDAQSMHLMQRLGYRNFGSYESLVATHTVNVGSGVAGIRWYEIQVSPPNGTPSVVEDSTYAPGDGIDRWMGSVAMDGAGDIALGYSMSNGSSEYPSVGYTGSASGSGTMGLGETTMIAGGGSQTGSIRWGDYSAMSIDPSDDETFWYTQEYYSATSTTGWRTRIGSFRLVQASSATLTQINGNSVAFPYLTNHVTSIAGGCTSGDGGVTWSVSGAASESGSAPCSSGAWTATLTTQLSTDGSYTLSAAQGTASSPSQSLMIDATAPSAPTLTALPAYIRNGESLSATNVSDNSGGSGVKQVNYLYCPGLGCTPDTLIGSSSTAGGNYAVSWNAQPTDGSYRVIAQTEDNAGNTTDSALQSSIIDNTPPAVALTTVNGATVAFPYATNQSVSSIGGSCGSAPGDLATVSWSVSGAASGSGSVTCSAGTWSAPLATALSAAGLYMLSATQSDQAGNTGSSPSQTLTITDLPPAASFSFSPISPQVGQTLLFDGAASSDPDGTISFYAWSFGDGANASGATTSHAYAKPGTFTVQLSVTDNSGSVGMSAQSLAVASMSPDHAPVVKLKIPRQQLQFVLKRGLDVHISSNQAASATLRLMLPAAAAKALGVRKRPVTLATVTVRLRTGKMVALRLVLSRRARRHLRNRKIVTVTLTAAVTGPGGKTSLSRRLVLRRSTRHATASGLASALGQTQMLIHSLIYEDEH
jgi:PKD domain